MPIPILTNELRSPEERRSDHLTILKRRAPPPRSAGRFFKIVADTTAHAIGTFDPAFDSDADTDGPTSGSSIWRRDFSRVRSTSSTSIGFVHTARQLSDVRSDPRYPSRNDSDEFFKFDSFTRERAPSFYGRDNDHDHHPHHADADGDADADVQMPGNVATDSSRTVTAEQLRDDLQEDYDMFYHAGSDKRQDKKPTVDEQITVQAEGLDGVKPSPQAKVHTKSVNKALDVAACDARESGPTMAEAEEEKGGDEEQLVDKAVVEMEDGDLECGESVSLRTLKRFRLTDDPDRFTVSIVSSCGSGTSVEEIDEKVTGAARYSGVPLFVEEIGRVPRAAIIDGEVRRVRIAREKSSFREAVSRARRSSLGWRLSRLAAEDGFLRRRRRSAASALHIRGGWARVKRMLFGVTGDTRSDED